MTAASLPTRHRSAAAAAAEGASASGTPAQQADPADPDGSRPNPYRSPQHTSAVSVESGATVYGPQFWCAYAANAALVTANSLLLRYVEFVKLHEPVDYRLLLGWIVGVGMVGSLLMRLVQGTAIDRYGARLMWVGSATIYVATCLAHLFVTDVHGPAVFALRIFYSTSLAGAFGASMVYVSHRAGPERMAEMIGTLGTSGFVGTLFGPVIGDYLFPANAPSPTSAVTQMFCVAAGLGVLTLVCAFLATVDQTPPAPARRRPPVLWLLRRYYPGPVLWVGVAMGIGIGVSTTFMADFTDSIGVGGIRAYFITFAVTAFFTRLCIRQFPQRYGIRAMLLLGGAAQTLSFVCLLPVSQEWHLIVPAAMSGFAHAFLFPGVVAGGGTAFPERYRGLGTTLMLGTLDFGIFLGAPAAGALLNFCRACGWPEYPVTFLTTAGLVVAVAGYYAWRTRPKAPLTVG